MESEVYQTKSEHNQNPLPENISTKPFKNSGKKYYPDPNPLPEPLNS